MIPRQTDTVQISRASLREQYLPVLGMSQCTLQVINFIMTVFSLGK